MMVFFPTHRSIELNKGEGIPLGEALREQFPIFANSLRASDKKNLPLVYLDSAATAQKPRCVINAMTGFLEAGYGSVHRGAYDLSVKASNLYEETRKKVATLLGPSVRPTQIVYTRGATESLNILANGIAERYLDEGSRIVVAAAEHHANLVPWQQAALKKDCEIAYIPLVGIKDGELRLDLDKARKLMTPNTKVVAFAHSGNVLGQINPVAELVQLAKSVGAIVVADCAQSISSLDDDLFALGVDAVACSTHKFYGPSGVGVLAAREELLQEIPPLIVGGGMISDVTLEESTWATGVSKFEAGTPPLVEVVGMAAAIDWLLEIDRRRIHEHAAKLASKFVEGLRSINGIDVRSPSSGQETLVSFRHDRVHAHDLATILDAENVAVRAGHHCAWPLVRLLGVDALVRASFAAYSDEDDVDTALRAIKKAVSFL